MGKKQKRPAEAFVHPTRRPDEPEPTTTSETTSKAKRIDDTIESPLNKRLLLILGAAFLVGVVLLAANWFLDRRLKPEPNAWPDTDLLADDVQVYKTTDSRPLHLHLFVPDTSGTTNRPAVVFFHGGGLSRTPLDQFAPQAKALRAEGVVVAIAEYRVLHDGGTPDTSLADAADAVAWLRAEAANLSINPDQIAAGGGSAGGWLAADTAIGDDRPPDALLLFNPAVNSTEAPTTDIPIIVFHGDADRTVDLSRAQGYCDAASNCRIDIWPGGDHGFFNAVNSEAHAHTTAEAIAFLRELDWI